MKEKCVPSLRFKGFDKGWEEKELGMISDSFSGGTPSANIRSYYGGTIPFIRSGEISFAHTELTLTTKGFQQSSAKMVKKGDILYALYGATSGEVAVSQISGAINQAILAITPKENYETYFISQWLLLKKIEIITTYLQGGQGNLSASIVNSFKIIISKTLSEQTKIGNYFKNLDELINLNQAKYDKLQNAKKALLEKIFPKENSLVPELRFKGFNGEWEEKDLESLAEFNPKSILPDFFKYIDLESVMGTRLLQTREESKNTAPSRAQHLAKTGDLFYQTVRPYQKNNYLFMLYETDYVFSSGYAHLRPHNSGYFLLALIQQQTFVQDVLERCTGTSYPAITSTLLAKIQVTFSSSPTEQSKIGNLFQKLDKLINLQETKIQKLQNIKKACLAKMFV